MKRRNQACTFFFSFGFGFSFGCGMTMSVLVCLLYSSFLLFNTRSCSVVMRGAILASDAVVREFEQPA